MLGWFKNDISTEERKHLNAFSGLCEQQIPL
jgi:hypothetical protein